MASRRDPPATAPTRAKRAGRGRPRKIGDTQLLEVAREVFLEQGIRATTAEVAQRAGVSEGVVFHRFQSKEQLFRAAMKLPEDAVPQMLMGALKALEGLELRHALERLATTLLDIGRVAVPLMMMSWSNPAQRCAPPYERKRAEFRVFLRRLVSFFELHMQQGRLRPSNPEVLARTFLGALYHYNMTRVLSDPEVPTIAEKEFAAGLVDLLLNGAAVPSTSLQSKR
jgi:AcrR family transcriptional regulator